MNNQLTLLVFLKDRASFTKRLFDYLSKVQYPFPVLFADGSIEDENELFFNEVKFADFSYQYIRYPKDERLSDYYEKCVSAIEKVKTPYVMLADNDDFPIIDGQLKALDFLNSHPDYIGCNGRVGGVIVNPVSHHASGNNVLYLPYYCPMMDVPVPLDQDTAIRRIQSYLRNFYSFYYAIYRTENMANTLEKIREFNFSDLGIVELFFSYMKLAQGKVHTIDSLTYLRQKGSSQAAASQKDWFHRLFYTNWLPDLKIALRYTAEIISHNESTDIHKTYDQLYEDFLNRFRQRFIPNGFYFYKNPQLIFNKIFLSHYLLNKIFKLSPKLGEQIGFYSLNKQTPPLNLETIRDIILIKP